MGDSTAAPYNRIAAELRAQIETGKLAPADRVPSTREITRQWGVAMATATKALAVLRREGLVRPIPGVGTVVADGARSLPGTPPPAPATPAAAPGLPAARRRGVSDPVLAPERIVAAAIAVADAEGLAGFSMRRVATEIGVATMSVYRHVIDKDDLLLKMMDAAFGECRFPAHPPDGWRQRLELAARTLWGMFHRHPWLAPALSVTRPQPIASGLAATEWVLAALDGRGLDLPTMLTTHITLFNYVRGTALNLELEADAEAISGLDSEQWLDTQESTMRSMVAAGRFPLLGRIFATEYDFDLESLFEFGLQRMLDGLAVLIDARSGSVAGWPATAILSTMTVRRIPCVGAVIKDAAGRLLLIKRGHEPGKGLWSIPGGRIEPGESDALALVREVREETGLAVVPGRLLGVVQRPGLAGAVVDISDYLAVVIGGELTAGDDAADARWVTSAQIAQLEAGGELTRGLTEALTSWGVLP